MNVGEILLKLWTDSGFAAFGQPGGWKYLVMIAIACVLLYHCLRLPAGESAQGRSVYPRAVGSLYGY